jgi:hypothetical protein
MVIISRPLHGLPILALLIPSSELRGYYHSSALRTDNSTFWARPRLDDYVYGGAKLDEQ